MAIENADFTGNMNTGIPVASDSMSEGALQIQAVKHAITNTFPNIRGKVNATHDELNQLKAGKALFYVGMIVPFWGDTLPSKFWAWCDGNNGTPNLNSDEPTYLAGTSGAKGAVVGKNKETDMAKYLKFDGHGITMDEMAPHGHSTLWHKQSKHTYEAGSSGAWGAINYKQWYTKPSGLGGNPTGSAVGQPHDHKVINNSKEVFDNRPKTVAIKFIMYIGKEATYGN